MPDAIQLVEPTHATLHPALTEDQLECVARFAVCHEYAKGDVLFEHGQRDAPFIVLETGSVDIFEKSADDSRRLIARVIAKRFIGDLSMFTGEPTLAEAVATEPCRALVMGREKLRELIAEHSDVGDIILRCLIERREWLKGNEIGFAKLVGSRWSPEAFRLRDFLARNQVLFRYYDVEADDEAEALLSHFDIKPEETPVLICANGVARNPSVEDIAEHLGFKPKLDDAPRYDLVVVGAGPGGLAAAVYGASEGLNTLVIEGDSPGGQAGTSSKIENYLGFPTGLSGQELTQRALLQARKFGATISNPTRVDHLVCEGSYKQLTLSDGTKLEARSVVVATGAQYRKLEAAGCADFEGRGVYYGASYTEAVQCKDEHVFVVGGGNSAGQAAINLAQHARHVCIVIRRDTLSESMSRYLIDRIERSPNIELIRETEIACVEGNGHLEAVTLRRRDRDGEETVQTPAVFVMIGAEPNACWADDCVLVDDKGFIITGDTAQRHPRFMEHWTDAGREPFMLEASRPGIFAVGDVRSGSVKRVASAVGEGSMSVKYIHAVLAGSTA